MSPGELGPAGTTLLDNLGINLCNIRLTKSTMFALLTGGLVFGQ